MSTGLPLAVAVLGSACTRANPGFGADTDGDSGSGDTADTQDDDSDSDSVSASTTMTTSASMSTTDDPTTDPDDTGGMAVCGDGVLEGDEQCDEGANNANDRNCTEMCRHAKCGDGLRGPGEGCDDGNEIDDDACSNACVSELCGNMMVDKAEGEECDPTAPVGDVICTEACTANVCHDGHWLGEEDCDDGNLENTDGCVAECKIAGCGDGYVWDGMEACDDDNFEDDDGCVACALAECGDGYVHIGAEDCDPMAEESYACATNGFFAGEGACTPNCNLDVSSCTNCGDGDVDDNEICDFGEGANAIVCPEGDGWSGEGMLSCQECLYVPMGGCCQTAGAECNPLDPNPTCCGECDANMGQCIPAG